MDSLLVVNWQRKCFFKHTPRINNFTLGKKERLTYSGNSFKESA